MTETDGQNRFRQMAAAVIVALICVRFSAAYFTYAMVSFVLFSLYCWVQNGRTAFRFGSDFGIRLFGLALLTFYGALLLAAALQWDAEGAKVALSHATYSIAFLMTYTLCRFDKSENGVEMGFLLSAFLIVAYAFWSPEKSLDGHPMSFFAHQNHLGTYCAIFFPFSLYMTFRKKQEKMRWAAGIVTGLLAVCLWQTASRGAVLGLAGGLVLATIMVLFFKRKFVSCKTWAVALTALFLTLMMGMGAAFTFTSDRGSQATIFNSGGERLLMWQASIEMWEDHKWIGVGLDNWGRAYYSDAYHPSEAREEGHDMPHNLFLQFLSTAGLVGLAGYLSWIGFSVAALYETLKSVIHPLFTVAALAALFVMVIQGVFDTTIVNVIPARIFFALMGYYFATYQGKREI